MTDETKTATLKFSARIEVQKAIGNIDSLLTYLDEIEALATFAVESFELRELHSGHGKYGSDWERQAPPVLRRIIEVLGGPAYEELQAARERLYEASRVRSSGATPGF